MALFNEVLAGRFNRLLQKLLVMKGQAPAPQLSGDIIPAIIIENEAPEYYALHGGRLCTGYTSLGAGGAGNRSLVQLWNPPNSGVIVRVEEIFAVCPGGARTFYVWSYDTGGLATPTTNAQVRDRRLSQAPAALIQTSNGGAPVGTIVSAFVDGFSFDGVAGYTNFGTQRVPWVLDPQSSIIVGPSADNTIIDVVFTWRERAAEQSELQGI